jgi:hypothetical protein
VSDRPRGVVTYRSPKNPLAEEAKQHQEQLQRQREERAAADRQRRYDNAPNRICYAELYEQWKANGGDKLPKCKKCRATIHWEEHHDCPGFIPRYRTDNLTPEERRAIHQAKMENEGDWDDDQYDPTTPGTIIRHPDEEDSGTVEHCSRMTEYEWFMQKFGYIPSSEDYED